MKIFTVSYSYPSNKSPHHGIFVKNLMKELAAKNEITVVAPQNILSRKAEPIFYHEDGISVYRPKYISFGSKRIFGFVSYSLTQYFFNKAVSRVVKREKIVADVVYSHFLIASGVAALKAAELLNSPVFCTLGESSLDVHEKKFSLSRLRKLYAEFDGFFFNSGHTKDFAVKRYQVPDNKCFIVPNGVDKSLFYPRDKDEARKMLGLAKDEKILIFVGSFIERKGPLRVMEACKLLKIPVKLIFIGSGPQVPKAENVLLANTVENSELPWYLSASDVFVLPTLNEGMPNAVLEAMACGLSVVTSPIEPNIELLGEDYALFADPLNIHSIADKIEQAFNEGSVTFSSPNTLESRADLILETLEKSIR